MADDDSFEPRLGPIGRRAARPATQLKSLARLARWGKPATIRHKRISKGTVKSRGRGKGAAAITQNWAEPERRRAFVRVNIAPARLSGTAAFSSHIDYIRRDHTNEDGSRAPIFDRDQSDLAASDFKERSRGDDHQFRITLAPSDAGELEDLTAFTRRLMRQVDRDLRTQTDWIAAAHYNSPRPHVHIVVRGKNEEEGVLIIDRKYLTHGLRHRAEELLTEELGQQTWRERSLSRKREETAEQLTSIDWDLDTISQGGRISLAATHADLQSHGWSRKVARLQHLEKLGLARHDYGGAWQLAEGWKEKLRSLGERTAALNRLAHDLRRAGIAQGALSDAASAAGTWITGRLISRAPQHGLRGGETAFIDGIDGRLWVWKATPAQAEQLPPPGAVVSVEIPPGHPRSDITPGGPAERDYEPAANRIRIFVNSWIALDELVERRAFNWLDEISEDAVSGHVTGFGAEVRAARRARIQYLLKAPLDFSESEELHRREFLAAASRLAKRLERPFAELQRREIFHGEYLENIDTPQGRFAVIASTSRFTLMAFSEEFSRLRGQPVTIEPDIGRIITAPGRARGITRD